MTDTPLGDGPEFDRIRAFARALGDAATGLGDDCAVLPDSHGKLVISTDVSVENVHFRREWLTPEEIGWRAAAAALSDLAAAGASAAGVLAAVAVPRSTPEGETLALMRGIGNAAVSVGARVIGGDLSSSSEWMVTVTVVGYAVRPVTRIGARPGDGIWVTGALGGARAALDAWRAGAEPAADARRAFAHPEPRVAAGRWLGDHGARAMLDLSDGLAADARHLAAASGVRLDIQLERVPTSPAAVTAALAGGKESPVYAAGGGEDYELLVALPPEFGMAEQDAFGRACGIGITRVGEAQRGSGVRLHLRGERVTLRGFDHFA